MTIAILGQGNMGAGLANRLKGKARDHDCRQRRLPTSEQLTTDAAP